MNSWDVFSCQIKNKCQKTPTCYKKTQVPLLHRISELKTTCLCLRKAVCPKTRQSKTLQSTWIQINSLKKSFTCRTWKAEGVISIFNHMQKNYLETFCKDQWRGLNKRWKQWEHFKANVSNPQPRGHKGPWTAKNAALQDNKILT